MWIASCTVARSAGHPFYERLNQLRAKHDFDRFVEGKCRRFYAKRMGRPALAPGIYFRLLLVGYFEGIDRERGIAWRRDTTVADLVEREAAMRPPEEPKVKVGGIEEVVADKGYHSGHFHRGPRQIDSDLNRTISEPAWLTDLNPVSLMVEVPQPVPTEVACTRAWRSKGLTVR